MDKNCPKCGAPRNNESPTTCLKCGAIYTKVEARIKQQAEHKAKKEQEALHLADQERTNAAERHLEKRSICTQCGHFGQPTTITKGSIWIEILLWLFFLIPGLIYSIWRLSSKYEACPQCRHASMIPASSPQGRKLVKETNQ